MFSSSKLPPLTAYCTKLSAPTNLLKAVGGMTADVASKIDNRAILLSLIIMAAAGDFVHNLHTAWQDETWEKGSRRYLRVTNLDVIAAEAIVWLHFVLARIWLADCKNNPEMNERVGSGVPFHTAYELARAMIQRQTGVDFNARWIESRCRYFDAQEESGSLSYEPFAAVVLRSIGCRSLTEPLKPLRPLHQLDGWPPLALQVGTFFATMPKVYYDTFKQFLDAWPERFLKGD